MRKIFPFFWGKLYLRYTKRVIDVLGSFFLILLFLPVSLVVTVLIKSDSKGPIFAKVPKRVGRNGRLFKMYKFRSMIENAHYLLRTNPKFKKLYELYKRDSYKLRKDPRVTRIGKFIRKHSLDELPQLLNVLKGDMSLVGPRAYYPDELQEQQRKFPHTKEMVKEVLSVKPGITGLWQVSGRSEINFDKRMEIDVDYVRNISLFLDLKIIFKTPIIMLNGKGAV